MNLCRLPSLLRRPKSNDTSNSRFMTAVVRALVYAGFPKDPIWQPVREAYGTSTTCNHTARGYYEFDGAIGRERAELEMTLVFERPDRFHATWTTWTNDLKQTRHVRKIGPGFYLSRDSQPVGLPEPSLHDAIRKLFDHLSMETRIINLLWPEQISLGVLDFHYQRQRAVDADRGIDTLTREILPPTFHDDCRQTDIISIDIANNTIANAECRVANNENRFTYHMRYLTSLDTALPQ